MAVDDYSTALLVSSVLMISVATVAVAMRLCVRMILLGGLGWDDALITMSWVLSLALCTATLAARNYGFGMHMDGVSPQDISTFSRLIMVCSTTYSWGVPAAKASFAVFYLRILQGRQLARLNQLLMAFLLCQALEETLVVVFQCRPVAKAWDASLEGSCHSLVPLWWCTFVFNLVAYLVLFLQPVPSMWRLQLPVTKRVGVIAMLSLGLLVCVISIIRIVYVARIGSDRTYDLAQPMIWSQVELTALILCSCIPSLRQVVQKIPWLNHVFGPASHKDVQTHNNYGGYAASRIAGRGVSPGAAAALHGRWHDPLGPTRSRNQGYDHRSAQFGMVIRAERGGHGTDHEIDMVRPPSQDGSTDEIFPYRAHGDALAKQKPVAGAILVTHDIQVELSHNAHTMFVEGDEDEDDDDGDSSTRVGSEEHKNDKDKEGENGNSPSDSAAHPGLPRLDE